MIHQGDFQDFCRNGHSLSFIRNRKMPLTDLLFISKPGYLKQRMKLNPLAFYELYRYHNRNFYAEPGFSTFQGYLVLAVDGCNRPFLMRKCVLNTMCVTPYCSFSVLPCTDFFFTWTSFCISYICTILCFLNEKPNPPAMLGRMD